MCSSLIVWTAVAVVVCPDGPRLVPSAAAEVKRGIPPKTVCGCPTRMVIKNGHTSNLSINGKHLLNATAQTG